MGQLIKLLRATFACLVRYTYVLRRVRLVRLLGDMFFCVED